jgi:hypothetical protein
VNPGEQAFLFDIGRVKNPERPQVLVSAARVYEEKIVKKAYSFVVKSPLNTTNVIRILLPEKATTIEVIDSSGKLLPASTSWDESSKTCFLSFENNPDGVRVQLRW